MSGLFGLLIVSLSVGLSNFAGAIGIGLSGINARTRIRVGLAFGFFEALMPLIGLLLGRAAAGYIGGHLTGYVAGGILILTGGYTIWQGWGLEKKETPPPRLQMQSLIVTAAALSIDNLAVGFALAVYHVPIVLAAVTMGAVSVAMSLLGLELGSRLGRRIEGWSEELGGGMLVLVGIAIATGILG
ncbi:MAG: manganese efflux pump MntP family protein [Candidatus Dormibacteraeota bacterium]|nr:manganese efflux pump MntP family protein [Candidatus Dormibacteraeota bacterium]